MVQQRFKIHIKEQKRRVALDSSYQALALYVQEVLLQLGKKPIFQLNYKDAEGDWILVSSEEEYQEALLDLNENSQAVLNIRVVTEEQEKRQECPFKGQKGCHNQGRSQQCPFNRQRCHGPSGFGGFPSGPNPFCQMFNNQQGGAPELNLGDLIGKAAPFIQMFAGNMQNNSANQPNLGDLFKSFMQPQQQNKQEKKEKKEESKESKKEEPKSSKKEQEAPKSPFDFLQQVLGGQQQPQPGQNPFESLIKNVVSQFENSMKPQEEPKKEEEPKEPKKEDLNNLADELVESLIEIEREQPEEESQAPEYEEVSEEQRVEDAFEQPSAPEEEGPFETELSLLESMGFSNGALNKHVLEHHKGNVQRSIEALLKLNASIHQA